MGQTPTYNFPYPNSTDPDNVPVDMQELAAAIEGKFTTEQPKINGAIQKPASPTVGDVLTWNGTAWASSAPSPPVSYATTLPASPVSGQEAILVDSNPPNWFVWRFRFNPSATTYKWEFIGGVPYINSNADIVAISSNPSAWSKSVPVTFPRDGVYTVQATTEIVAPATGADVQVRHGFAPTSDAVASLWNANVIWQGAITQGMSPLIGWITVAGAPVSWSHFIWADVAGLTSARRAVIVTPWAVV